MDKLNPFAFALVTAVAVTAFAGTASAEVGKQISVTTVYSGIAPAAPAFTDAVTLAVPTSYKSRSNILRVTTSYQASCVGGDKLRSKVTVGGIDMVDAGLPVDTHDEDAGYQIVTKTYYLASESMGGPIVAPASSVVLQLTSQLGTGCYVGSGTMFVEAVK
jgi:hypothetical protein